MAVDWPRQNAVERERLETLVEHLKPAHLALRLENSEWTVGAALAHLAFWDRVIAFQLREWQLTGVAPGPVTEESVELESDGEAVNHAALAQWLAMPAKLAAREAIEAAREVDASIESAPQIGRAHV